MKYKLKILYIKTLIYLLNNVIEIRYYYIYKNRVYIIEILVDNITLEYVYINWYKIVLYILYKIIL